jgi:hypothetical protein
VLDQAQEIVPQCRFWFFSLWIHGRTHEPCFDRGVSANAKLGPPPVFVNGNRRGAGKTTEIFASVGRGLRTAPRLARDCEPYLLSAWRPGGSHQDGVGSDASAIDSHSCSQIFLLSCGICPSSVAVLRRVDTPRRCARFVPSSTCRAVASERRLVLNLPEFTAKAPSAPSSEKKESETLASSAPWRFDYLRVLAAKFFSCGFCCNLSDSNCVCG